MIAQGCRGGEGAYCNRRCWLAQPWSPGGWDSSCGPATSCWPVNEPGSHALHDLTELHFVHEAALLDHVRERYSGGSIYTYVGPTLVSLNPFRELPGVYGEEAC